MMPDEALLPRCAELLNTPVAADDTITWMGVQLKKTEACVATFRKVKGDFIAAIQENLDQRFPEDGKLVFPTSDGFYQ